MAEVAKIAAVGCHIFVGLCFEKPTTRVRVYPSKLGR